MDSYIIIFLLIDMAVLFGMTVHGWRKGFAGLLTEAIALIVSVWVVVMISSVLGLWKAGDSQGAVFGVLLLVVTGICYKIVRMILSSIRILSGLPILSGLNRIAGLAAGFCEGFTLLYLLEYILRGYILV